MLACFRDLNSFCWPHCYKADAEAKHEKGGHMTEEASHLTRDGGSRGQDSSDMRCVL